MGLNTNYGIHVLCTNVYSYGDSELPAMLLGLDSVLS